MADTTRAIPQSKTKNEPGFVRAIGLFDGTMIVVGSMIGSGIFIVAADISRQTGSAGGLLLTWILTGLLTISAALSYGELAALFPHAGGQYVYLREAYSPLWGFLYGWTLFLVIQTGTIAAVAVGFARYLGVLLPAISPNVWVVRPIALGSKYAISLSVQQLVGVLMIVFLTFINTLGVRLGKAHRAWREFPEKLCAGHHCCKRRVWLVCGLWSGAGRFAVFCGRLEQYRFYCR